MTYKKTPSTLEKELVVKALEGKCKVFKTLTRQVISTNVCSRSLENGRYLVEFEPNRIENCRLKDAEANIEIEGTLLRVKETDEILYIRIVVLDGELKYLEITGNFDFRNPFTISKILWENKVDGSLRNAETVSDPNLRNCKESISYIPMYK